MISAINNGFIAELGLIAGNLFLELFAADKAFRPIQTVRVQPVNTATTSTVTFTDARLFNGFQYFARFITESGGLLSGETDFLGFVPTLGLISRRITEAGDVRITEAGDTRILED